MNEPLQCHDEDVQHQTHQNINEKDGNEQNETLLVDVNNCQNGNSKPNYNNADDDEVFSSNGN